MQLIDFALGAFESDARDEGRFVDSIPIAAGQGAVEVRCVHMMPGRQPPGRIEGGALGELPNGHDHLFLVLEGSGRVSGGRHDRRTDRDRAAGVLSEGRRLSDLRGHTTGRHADQGRRSRAVAASPAGRLKRPR